MFKQAKPKENVFFKGLIWDADETGKKKRLASPVRIAVGPEYIWLESGWSIPLNWHLRLDPLGPGFRLTWVNPLATRADAAGEADDGPREQHIDFCLRGFVGYSAKKSRLFQQRLQEAVRLFPGQTRDPDSCQVCGVRPAYLFTFTSGFSFIHYSGSQRAEYALCRPHGRERFQRIYRRNYWAMLLGPLGWVGGINRSNCRVALAAGAISPRRCRWLILATYLPLVLMVLGILYGFYAMVASA